MKKTILLAALACWTVGMTAQNAKGKFSIKPMTGINVTTFSGSIFTDVEKSRGQVFDSLSNIIGNRDAKELDQTDYHGDRYCFKNQTFKQENGLY